MMKTFNPSFIFIKCGLSLIQVPTGVSFGEDALACSVVAIAGKGDEHMEYLQHITLICKP